MLDTSTLQIVSSDVDRRDVTTESAVVYACNLYVSVNESFEIDTEVRSTRELLTMNAHTNWNLILMCALLLCWTNRTSLSYNESAYIKGHGQMSERSFQKGTICCNKRPADKSYDRQHSLSGLISGRREVGVPVYFICSILCHMYTFIAYIRTVPRRAQCVLQAFGFNATPPSVSLRTVSRVLCLSVSVRRCVGVSQIFVYISPSRPNTQSREPHNV